MDKLSNFILCFFYSFKFVYLEGGCSYPVSVLSGLDFLLCWKGRAFQKREKQSQGKVCLCLITSVGELLNMYISATGKVSNRVMSS